MESYEDCQQKNASSIATVAEATLRNVDGEVSSRKKSPPITLWMDRLRSHGWHRPLAGRSHISILRCGRPQLPALSLPLPLLSLKIDFKPRYQINNPPKAHTKEVIPQPQSAPKRSPHRHLPAAPTSHGNSHEECVQKAPKYAAKVPLSHPKNTPNLNKVLYLGAKTTHPPPVLPPFRRFPCQTAVEIALRADHDILKANAFSSKCRQALRPTHPL